MKSSRTMLCAIIMSMGCGVGLRFCPAAEGGGEDVKVAEKKNDAPPNTGDAPAADNDSINKHLDDLNSQDAAVRETASKAILKLLQEPLKKTEKPYLQKINSDLGSEKVEVRVGATTQFIEAINSLRQGNAPLLIAKLNKLSAVDNKEREDAGTVIVTAIDDILESKLIDQAGEDLASADAAVFESAQKKLMEIGAAAAPSMVDLLDDDRPMLMKRASDILIALGPKAKDAASDLAFILDSDNKSTRRLAGAVLLNLGPDAVDATSDLVNYLDNEEKPVRNMAANILKKMGPAAHEATLDLIGYLTDDDMHSRSLASDVLINLGAGAKEGVEDLAKIVDDAINDNDSRERAATVLASIGPDARVVLEVLKKFETDPSPTVAAAVGKAIAKIQGK